MIREKESSIKTEVSINVDADLSRKINKTCDRITENLYVASNEPMLAGYRIQEHVKKTIPILANKSSEMHKNEYALKGLLYDIEYSHSTVKSLQNCFDHFGSIHQLVKDCVFYKQQIDYNESVQKRVHQRMLQQQDSQESVNPPKPTTLSSRSDRGKKAANAFNRFSTSFDFSSASFPVNVASSVSADLKSLITQYASNTLHHGESSRKERPSRVVPSSSLQVLTETPIPREVTSLPLEKPQDKTGSK